MHQVQLELTDQLYNQAKLRAVEAGFSTVNEYLYGVVTDDLTSDSDNFDHVFSPEQVALIDKAEAQIEKGQSMTAKEADVELARRRTEWLKNNRA